MTAYLQQLFSSGLYKRAQGKVARQATFYALAIVVAAGAWSLHGSLRTSDDLGVQRASTPVALSVLALGCWAAFRLIQLPKFADFLIAVEAEMNKVSWPSRASLFRASAVVIAVIFLLAMLLFGYDVAWKWLLGLILTR
ncbi:preprotein translocase subunit SecE [Pirellulimonas nuda]|uniref:Protein translocase subunit SecE n=1 Tax=Pirellulimonas nuda TaxID=2528009 RepID=A0A518DIW7_9BACT|nr:preprotein translocase subunit SecE [Pirellulimonas nuda]QDU91427.1 preprotein translocase subunit SecE [Pirellulimonas nuda]